MTGIQRAISELGRDVFADLAKKVFFTAMNMGYVGDAAKGKIAKLPCSHTIEHTDGPWRVLDVYTVTLLSDVSAGTTHIWFEDVPVWMMQYMGEYAKEAIPTLKRALALSYARHEWNGGRGPNTFNDGDYCYENNVGIYNAFAGKSHGEEFIMRAKKGGGMLGYHRYQSLYMV